MTNLTRNDIYDLNEAYKQIYSEIEYDQLDEDWWNPSTWFGPSPQQKAEERRRLQQAQTAAAEKVDRMVGRAHQLPNSGTRYTVNLNPNTGQVVRRSEGQIAQLGGRRVKWEVNDKGEGKWVPSQPEFKPNLQYVGTTGSDTRRIDPTKDDMGRPIQSTPPTRSTTQSTSQGRTSTTRPAVTTTRPATSSTSRNTIPSYSGATNVSPVGTPAPTNMVRPVAGAPTQGSEVSIQRPVNRLMTGMPTVPSMAGPVGGPKLSARAQALRSGGPQGSARSRVLNQSFDPFDVVMGYLIDEGYADSEDSAVIIMSNMSEDWVHSIVEGYIDLFKTPPARGRSMKGDPSKGEKFGNPARLSPAMRALQRSDQLRASEPGSRRQIMQTRRSGQINRTFRSARLAGGASPSLGGIGTPSGTGRYTPGGRYGIGGVGLAD